MATTETLLLMHVLVSGDFDPEFGEAHVSLRITVRSSGGEREVIALEATDLDTGALYDRHELTRLADERGRADLAGEIDVAIERFEATGNRGPPCLCPRCARARPASETQLIRLSA